jgi:endonuclease/exonuclease/phosphatase family metal-dependent hydrolase
LLWWRAEGLALLSRYPMSAPVSGSISPDVSTWSYRHRIAVAATVRRDTHAVRLVNVHLDTSSVDARIAQAARAAALVGSARPAVVAGDLNATNDTEVLREFRALAVVDAGGDATTPAAAPVRRLDYVLVPESATVTSSLTPPGGDHWAQLSDHLPVVVEFTLPEA